MRTVAAVVAFVVCVHAALWALLQRHQAIANIENPLASVSYSPYTRSQHPDRGDRPTEQQIRADLKVLSSYTQAIRTYSTTAGGELVPGIAAEFGLKVALGIWIDKNEARNEREIQAAIDLRGAIATSTRSSLVTRRSIGRRNRSRAHRAHSAGEAAVTSPRNHRRNLVGVDRAS